MFMTLYFPFMGQLTTYQNKTVSHGEFLLFAMTEATSALDLDAEKAMYDLLEEKLKATYVSVGHRPSLLKFHSTRLVVSPEQPLLVETIDPFSAADAVEATAMMEFTGKTSSV
jgi:ABC-type lipoprotein export system ATPase subunit